MEHTLGNAAHLYAFVSVLFLIARADICSMLLQEIVLPVSKLHPNMFKALLIMYICVESQRAHP